MSADMNLKIVLSAIDRATGPVRRFTARLKQSMRDAEGAARRFHEAMERATNVQFAAQAMDRFSAGVANVMRAPIQSAVDFESAMADVRKVVDFPEPAGLSKLSARLLEMSKTIPITAPGLAQIAAAGGQLGVTARDLPDFVQTAAKMSVAFDMAAEESGDAMAKLSNVYGIAIQDTGRLGDAINHLSDNTAAKAAEIVRVLQRIGGNARQFGLAATQAAALADAFVALGRPPEVAATAINAMLAKLQTASQQGQKFGAVLRYLGSSAGEMEQAIAVDAQGALLDFLTRLEKLDPARRAKAVAAMFGLEYADDVSLLVNSLDKYRQALGLVAEETSYAGSMTREFENRSQTAANGFVLLQNRMFAFRQTLGEAILPQVKELTDTLGGVVDKVAAWTKEHPVLTKAVLVLAGALAVLSAVISKILMLIAALIIIKGGLPMMLGKVAKAGGAVTGVFKSLGKALGRLPGLATRAVGSLKPLLGMAARAAPALSAFAGGYGIGSLIYDKLLAGNAVGNAIGAGVARVASIFGSEEARQAIAINSQQPLRGEVKITIDQEGRARVREVQSDSSDMALEVDSGMLMAGP